FVLSGEQECTILLCCQIYRRVTACWCRDLHLTCILGCQVRLSWRGGYSGSCRALRLSLRPGPARASVAAISLFAGCLYHTGAVFHLMSNREFDLTVICGLRCECLCWW